MKKIILKCLFLEEAQLKEKGKKYGWACLILGVLMALGCCTYFYSTGVLNKKINSINSEFAGDLRSIETRENAGIVLAAADLLEANSEFRLGVVFAVGILFFTCSLAMIYQGFMFIRVYDLLNRGTTFK